MVPPLDPKLLTRLLVVVLLVGTVAVPANGAAADAVAVPTAGTGLAATDGAAVGKTAADCCFCDESVFRNELRASTKPLA